MLTGHPFTPHLSRDLFQVWICLSPSRACGCVSGFPNHPVRDQKAITIAKLLSSTFGVPEALLSDRGTNLLSHLMTDLCKMMEINTTAYHPQCDGMVERFNRTLKTVACRSIWRHLSLWSTVRLSKRAARVHGRKARSRL